MPYNGNGARHAAVATKAAVHGQIVEEDGFVGSAFKNEQLDRFVDPSTGDATAIPIGEEFEILLGGVHEAPLSGGIAALGVGDPVYIDPATNALLADYDSGGTDEIQTITVNATGGTFTVSFDGATTGAVAFNALAATLQAALEALPNVSPGDVSVSLSGSVYTITFGGDYAGENVPALTTGTGSLTGGTTSATVATSTAGVAGADALPVGIITEVDASRAPDVARINANAWAFFARRSA